MLSYNLQEVWDAFWILDKTRTVGMNGHESIKLVEVKALIELFQVEGVRSFIDYLYVLDEEYLKLIAKKQKEEEEDKKNKGKSNSLTNKGTGK